MFKINDNFLALNQNYLFSQVARKINAYMNSNPGVRIIRMGIGDVSRPLAPAVISALHEAVEEQTSCDTFCGYGPEQGHRFLTEAIAAHDYQARGIQISADEIFISDGAKSDTGNIGDILSLTNKVALTNPVYPVYLDTNIMSGRASIDNIELLPCTADNNFVPSLPTGNPDMIYLCYPNNPTGTTLNRDQLKEWVDYAKAHGALILFDSAYEAFITEDDVPHSIYEIEGATEVAIEFRSFSKTAGFTGLRCAYTVVPMALKGENAIGESVSLNALWQRRQSTKFNGASYLSQRAAEAVYSPEGKKQIRSTIDYYLRNATVLREGLKKAGLNVYGGVNAPYIWVKTPDGMDSWSFFDILLEQCNIACTPGVGFGSAGEGYVRLTAFGSYEDCLQAVERLSLLKM
ncbi:MAG: LL-diaminopimelate aminotransferase [Muribaculaceae bacterium]|nr:LL-diaminopimelate aminotransferase [Muribaculaceae bacterium]